MRLRPPRRRPASSWAQPRRQRRADARLAVAVAETTHLELGHRDEATQAVPAPDELLRVDGEGERAEGQRLPARLQEDVVPVRRGQPEGQAEVVEVGGEPQAGIDGAQRYVAVRAYRGEQEGVGVDRRRQVVRGLTGILGMHKGELREREETVAAQVDAGPPERGQGALGVIVEALCQAGTDQHLRSRRARLAGGEHARREGAIDLLRIDAGHTDRRRTGADQQEQPGEQQEPQGALHGDRTLRVYHGGSPILDISGLLLCRGQCGPESLQAHRQARSSTRRCVRRIALPLSCACVAGRHSGDLRPGVGVRPLGVPVSGVLHGDRGPLLGWIHHHIGHLTPLIHGLVPGRTGLIIGDIVHHHGGRGNRHGTERGSRYRRTNDHASDSPGRIGAAGTIPSITATMVIIGPVLPVFLHVLGRTLAPRLPLLGRALAAFLPLLA